jgi:hypothetical protein
MPLYTYENVRNGRRKEMFRTVAMRRMVPRNWRLVIAGAPAAVGVAENPHTQEFGIRQGLKDLESKFSASEIERQLGQGMSLKKVKQAWSK